MSRAEYLDFGIGVEWHQTLMDRLRKALPKRIQATEVLEIPSHQKSIGALNVFLYRAKKRNGTPLHNYRDTIINLLSMQTLPILRTHPKKARAFNGRPGIWKLEQDGDSILVGLKALDGPIPRVDEVIRLIIEPDGENVKDSPAEIIASWDLERLDMWWDLEGVYYHPMEGGDSTEINRIKAK